ncbi:MAG: helix-turn-helix domain-containing protein [Oscillospiraceae bacterium]|nr:helix-turn-helix domain-containing protein [Oscillospiraceae bacterium]
MSNKKFQNMLGKYKNIIGREIGIIDENGNIIACTDSGKTGKSRENICHEIKFYKNKDEYIKDGYTYKYIERASDSMAEYILFVFGEDAEASKMASLLAISFGSFENLHDEEFNRLSFMKNVILDNILPGDIFLKSKELNFNESVGRLVYLVKFPAQLIQHDINSADIMQSMFPDKSKDFIVSLDERDIALIREIKLDSVLHNNNNKNEDIEKVAKEIVSTASSEFFTKVIVGIGSPVAEIKDLSRSFKEAQIALEVGKVFDNEKEIINYKNLGIGRIIYQLPTTLCEVFLQEVFKTGALESLDRESLMTIQSFFENNLNVSETSRRLFVHRNTLVYRLEKIKKLTGLDLREFEHAIVFKVALMVKKYLSSKPVKY